MHLVTMMVGGEDGNDEDEDDERGGDDDDAEVCGELAGLANDRQAVHARHLDVHQHPVGTVLLVTGQRLRPVVALRDDAFREDGADGLTEGGVIIDDEELPCSASSRLA